MFSNVYNRLKVAKVVVVGDLYVGKTSLINRYSVSQHVLWLCCFSNKCYNVSLPVCSWWWLLVVVTVFPSMFLGRYAKFLTSLIYHLGHYLSPRTHCLVTKTVSVSSLVVKGKFIVILISSLELPRCLCFLVCYIVFSFFNLYMLLQYWATTQLLNSFLPNLP